MIQDIATDPAAIFENHRAYIFGLAYRMLGSVMEAEDVVQDAYLRYQAAAQKEEIETPKAYLTTITTRLSLDVLKSARIQREEYVGSWLPEPLITTEAPSDLILKRESLTNAFLTILERLSPLERAIYLLREVFEYGYRDIAEIVEQSEANCRQLFSRSRKYLTNRNLRFEADHEKQQQLIGAFLFALEGKDVGALTNLLAEDIRFDSDGGGKVTAAINPIMGRDRVIRFVLGITRLRPNNMTMEFTETNGHVSVILKIDNALYSVWNFAIQDGLITNVWAVLNPDKLAAVGIEPGRG